MRGVGVGRIGSNVCKVHVGKFRGTELAFSKLFWYFRQLNLPKIDLREITLEISFFYRPLNLSPFIFSWQCLGVIADPYHTRIKHD